MDVLRSSLGEVRSAVSFLTKVPVDTSATMSPGAAAFALVGTGLGIAAAPAILVLGPAAPLAAATIAIATVATLTGALHLDGLADTADALAASGPAATRARKDPATGPAGVTALILVLVLEVALLGQLVSSVGSLGAALSLVLALAASRAMPPIAVALAPARVASDGLGAWFASHAGRAAAWWNAGTVVVVASLCSLILGRWQPVAALVIAAVLMALAGWWLVRLRSAMDGDLLGALVELSVAAALTASVLAEWPAAAA